MKPLAIALLVAFAVTPALSQTVYRCGNAYSQVACAQGRAVDIDDSRTASQHAEARRVAADERRLADDMRRDRLAQARDVRPAGAANLGGAPSVRQVALVRPTVQHKKKGKRLATAPFQPVEVLVIEPAPRARRSGA
jgi:hypothetical protein